MTMTFSGRPQTLPASGPSRHELISGPEPSVVARKTEPHMRIALLGNFLPRLCGIATFTTHVHEALRTRWSDLAIDVYAMVDPGRSYSFPPAVMGTIDQDERQSYGRAAEQINASGADLLWVQHEYGIFGGLAGDHILDLVDAASMPVIVTLHTVLEKPTADQRRVLDRLIGRASRLVVMAQRARTILRQVYAAPADKIAVIEHGVPDRAYVTPSAARQSLGLEDRKTILTFGLLSPAKGIERMIRAMPAILRRCPEALYYIVGATHPHLVAHEGERYRDGLKGLARGLGVERSLRWEDRFLEEEEVLARLAMADVYVTPYGDPGQITSGTLSYAMALGKPIVSTPYMHAIELLHDGRGKLIGFDDQEGLSDAVGSLLEDDAERERLAEIAYRHGRAITWSRLAERAVELYHQVLADQLRPASVSKADPCLSSGGNCAMITLSRW